MESLKEESTGNTSRCQKCAGTGIESYFNHGYGEDTVEPIKCIDCNGFGCVYVGASE